MDAYIDEDPWQQYKGFGEDKPKSVIRDIIAFISNDRH